MLWHKAWLETRWRVVIGFIVLVCSAAGVVFTYPYLAARIGEVDLSQLDLGGAFGAELREGLAATRDYRGYVWWQWFRQNLRDIWTVVAVLLGTGGLLAQATGGAALFTLSLPVSRRRLLGVRAAVGLIELTLLAIVPTLAISLLSPAIGESYSVLDGLVHAVCLVVTGAVFFSLAFLLSTLFGDVWRPALITLAAFYAIVFIELTGAAGRALPFGLITVMTGQSYFRTGTVPWGGLIIAVAISSALIALAVRTIEKRDF